MPNEKNDAYEVNTKNLDRVIAAFKGKVPMAKLGVLGKNNDRSEEGGNAEILKKHEFGGDGLPIRSVLRVPIIDNLQKYLEKSGLFENIDVTLKTIIDEKSFRSLIAKIGIVGEQVVADAFSTRGFGKWKASNMKFKKNHETLVETQQLRTSIMSQVDE